MAEAKVVQITFELDQNDSRVIPSVKKLNENHGENH